MTEHHFKLPGVPGGRTYLLEINPHYTVRTTLDNLNVIDARWIDTSSGLFIDITTVRADDAARSQGVMGALMCKDGHRYLVGLRSNQNDSDRSHLQENDIFPLRDSLFENTPVKIPYEYTKLLQAEYGEKSMTLTTFEGYTLPVLVLVEISLTFFISHTWNEQTKLWEPIKYDPYHPVTLGLSRSDPTSICRQQKRSFQPPRNVNYAPIRTTALGRRMTDTTS